MLNAEETKTSGAADASHGGKKANTTSTKVRVVN